MSCLSNRSIAGDYHEGQLSERMSHKTQISPPPARPVPTGVRAARLACIAATATMARLSCDPVMVMAHCYYGYGPRICT